MFKKLIQDNLRIKASHKNTDMTHFTDQLFVDTILTNIDLIREVDLVINFPEIDTEQTAKTLFGFGKQLFEEALSPNVQKLIKNIAKEALPSEIIEDISNENTRNLTRKAEEAALMVWDKAPSALKDLVRSSAVYSAGQLLISLSPEEKKRVKDNITILYAQYQKHKETLAVMYQQLLALVPKDLWESTDAKKKIASIVVFDLISLLKPPAAIQKDLIALLNTLDDFPKAIRSRVIKDAYKTIVAIEMKNNEYSLKIEPGMGVFEFVKVEKDLRGRKIDTKAFELKLSGTFEGSVILINSFKEILERLSDDQAQIEDIIYSNELLDTIGHLEQIVQNARIMIKVPYLRYYTDLKNMLTNADGSLDKAKEALLSYIQNEIARLNLALNADSILQKHRDILDKLYGMDRISESLNTRLPFLPDLLDMFYQKNYLANPANIDLDTSIALMDWEELYREAHRIPLAENGTVLIEALAADQKYFVSNDITKVSTHAFILFSKELLGQSGHGGNEFIKLVNAVAQNGFHGPNHKGARGIVEIETTESVYKAREREYKIKAKCDLRIYGFLRNDGVYVFTSLGKDH